jgi:hypothetical protein
MDSTTPTETTTPMESTTPTARTTPTVNKLLEIQKFEREIIGGRQDGRGRGTNSGRFRRVSFSSNLM